MKISEQITPALDGVSCSVEAKFAQRLASNEKKIRDRGFKKLRQYMLVKSVQPDGGFTRNELIKIWKGLFYCMWMSDKPLVQEELARNMAELMPLLRNIKTSMLYFETFFATMQREWRGIDRLRMDKFFLLVRFMLQQALVCLRNNDWDDGLIDWFIAILQSGPLSLITPGTSYTTGSPLGLRLHVIDIFLEELTTCGYDTLSAQKVTKLLQPYCTILCKTAVKQLRDRVMDKIFRDLMDQSDAAIKLVAEVEGVDSVDLPKERLNFDYASIADAMFEAANKPGTRGRNRQQAFKLVKKLQEISRGRVALDEFPDLLPDGPDVTGKKAEKELAVKLDIEMEKEFKARIQQKKQHRREKKKQNKKVESSFCDEGDELEVMEQEEVQDGEIVTEISDDAVVVDLRGKKGGKSKKTKKAAKVLAPALDGTSNQDISIGVESPGKVLIGSVLCNEDMVLEEGSQNESINSSLLDLNGTSLSKKQKTDKISNSSLFEEDSSEDITPTPQTKKNKQTPRKNKVESAKKNESKKQSKTIQSPDRIESVKKSAKKGSKRKLSKDDLKKLLSNDNATMNGANGESPKKKKKLSGDEKDQSDDIFAKDAFIKEKNFAKFKQSPVAPTAAFLRVAASKVNKEKTNGNKKTPNKISPVYKNSSCKKVSFEMSKIQIQPFKKNDRSSVLSPSPLKAPFDPRKTPDFGVLKPRRKAVSEIKVKTVSKKKRASASDFF